MKRILLLFAILLPVMLFGVGCTTTRTANVTVIPLGDPSDPETAHLQDVSKVGLEEEKIYSLLWLDKLFGIGLRFGNDDGFLVDARSKEERKRVRVSYLRAWQTSNSAVFGGPAIAAGLMGAAAIADSPSSSSNSSSSSAANASSQ